MANTSSAKKATRSALKKRVYNERRKRAMKSAVKDFKKFVSSGSGVQHLPNLYQAIDKAAKRGIINKGAAARMKSKLARMVATK